MHRQYVLFAQILALPCVSQWGLKRHLISMLLYNVKNAKKNQIPDNDKVQLNSLLPKHLCTSEIKKKKYKTLTVCKQGRRYINKCQTQTFWGIYNKTDATLFHFICITFCDLGSCLPFSNKSTKEHIKKILTTDVTSYKWHIYYN